LLGATQVLAVQYVLVDLRIAGALGVGSFAAACIDSKIKKKIKVENAKYMNYGFCGAVVSVVAVIGGLLFWGPR
jgi:hypothetical protein